MLQRRTKGGRKEQCAHRENQEETAQERRRNPGVKRIKAKLGEELAHPSELLEALIEQPVLGKGGEGLQGTGQKRLKELRSGMVIRMGATFGLGDDFIDQFKIEEVLRGDFQGFGSGLGFRRVAPHNGSTTLRRNDGVDGIFEHENAVANGGGQRSAGTALARNRDDDGHGQAGHFPEIMSDSLRLAALFGIHTGIGAWGIDENDYRAPEFRGELHNAQGFAVTLRLRLAEIAGEALFGVAPFLTSHNKHRPAVKPRHARKESGIVGEIAVAMNLAEILE